MPELRNPREVSESLPQQQPPPPSLAGDYTKPFSIREYVLAFRQKDIFQNWPFQEEYLNELFEHGIRTVLPPFEPLVGRSGKTSEETVSRISSSKIRLKSSEKKCENNNQNHHHHHHHHDEDDHHDLLRKRKSMSKPLHECVGDDEHNNSESGLTEEDDDLHLKACEGKAAIKVFTRRKVVMKFEFKGCDSANSKTRIHNRKGPNNHGSILQ